MYDALDPLGDLPPRPEATEEGAPEASDLSLFSRWELEEPGVDADLAILAAARARRFPSFGAESRPVSARLVASLIAIAAAIVVGVSWLAPFGGPAAPSEPRAVASAPVERRPAPSRDGFPGAARPLRAGETELQDLAEDLETLRAALVQQLQQAATLERGRDRETIEARIQSGLVDVERAWERSRRLVTGRSPVGPHAEASVRDASRGLEP